jgi:hypothetical protein
MFMRVAACPAIALQRAVAGRVAVLAARRLQHPRDGGEGARAGGGVDGGGDGGGDGRRRLVAARDERGGGAQRERDRGRGRGGADHGRHSW